MVIEIALRLQNVKLRGKNVSDGFLGSSFAGRAGYGDHRLSPQAANSRGQRLQSRKRLLNYQHLAADRKTRSMFTSDNRRGGATCERGFHEVMAIEPLATDGEEQLAFANRARVD